MKRPVLSCLVLGVAATAATCQWSTPIQIASVNTSLGEYDPCPTMDGLTLYFASTQVSANSYDIYRATRATRFSAFGPPSNVTELSSTSIEGGPCVRIDDCEIFFYANRSGGSGGYDLWRATRTTTAQPFGTPAPVVELNTSSSDLSPSLTADGLRIYFYSDRAGGSGGYDIWTAVRASWATPFSAPVPVAELDTASADRDPHVSADGLVMFFVSDRPGGVGSNDIWVATRTDTTLPFGNITSLAALSSTVFDHAPSFALFPDEVFFTSTRAGGPGSYDLYSARFTGLVANGNAGIASTQTLRFSDPGAPGLVYVAAAALGTTPGIPFGSRVLPLNADALLSVTVGGLPPLLNGYSGVLDQDGVAGGSITFAGFPALRGFRFFTAFLVLDALAPMGIRTLSNALETVVQ